MDPQQRLLLEVVYEALENGNSPVFMSLKNGTADDEQPESLCQM